MGRYPVKFLLVTTLLTFSVQAFTLPMAGFNGAMIAYQSVFLLLVADLKLFG